MTVWLNGSFVEDAKATVPLFDASVQHGVGLFETMIAEGGKVLRLRQHVERLALSASQLLLSRDLRVDPLCDAVSMALGRSALGSARIRLTLTGGGLNMLRPRSLGDEPTPRSSDPVIAVQVQRRQVYPRQAYESGVQVALVDGRLDGTDPFTGHKTIWYWRRLKALQEAAQSGCSEALWFDTARNLASACVGNVFVVKEGVVRTPAAINDSLSRAQPFAGSAVNPAALPGITRAIVSELLESSGSSVQVSALTIDDLLSADEVFLTNSAYGILPVCKVEASGVNKGAVGVVALDLISSYEALVAKECG